MSCKGLFLISPCTKNEILEMISSLDYNKAIGINIIPIKILKLAKEQIAEYLYQFTKRDPNLSVLTTDLPRCYEILIK